MKRDLPNKPAKRASDYQLDGFEPPRFARVVYSPIESLPHSKVIEAQAFEVDAGGNLVAAPNGASSRTPGSRHSLMTTGIGDTHTLVPGWIRVPGNFKLVAEVGQLGVPPGTRPLDALPAEGTVGENVWVQDKLYRWDEGMLEGILRAKADELAGILRNSSALTSFEL